MKPAIVVIQDRPLILEVGEHRVAAYVSLTSSGRLYTPRCSCGWRGAGSLAVTRAEEVVKKHAVKCVAAMADTLAPDNPAPTSVGQATTTGSLDVARMVIASATESRRLLAEARATILGLRPLSPEEEAEAIIEHARIAAQAEFGLEILALLDRLGRA